MRRSWKAKHGVAYSTSLFSEKMALTSFLNSSKLRELSDDEGLVEMEHEPFSILRLVKADLTVQVR